MSRLFLHFFFTIEHETFMVGAFMYQGCIDHNSGCIGASASRAIYRSRYIAAIYSGIAREGGQAARQLRKKNALKYMRKAQRMNSWPASGRSIMLHFISQIMDDVRVARRFVFRLLWSSRLRVQVLHLAYVALLRACSHLVNI